MALYKRNDMWWIDIGFNGKRVQKSTGTSDKVAAQRYHDQVKADLWKMQHFQEKPAYHWRDAVVRWLNESQHKRSLRADKTHLRWLDPHLRNIPLSDISRERIETIANCKETTGVSLSTVNRTLALIRSILRKA